MTTITATISKKKDIKTLIEFLDHMGVPYAVDDLIENSSRNSGRQSVVTLSDDELHLKLTPAFDEIKAKRKSTLT